MNVITVVSKECNRQNSIRIMTTQNWNSFLNIKLDTKNIANHNNQKFIRKWVLRTKRKFNLITSLSHKFLNIKEYNQSFEKC